MLVDGFARKFKYLRLSLTEKCNFRCGYCLPNGYLGPSNCSYLKVDEIMNLGTAFRDLGVEKIRLTGGEPTLRADLPQIIDLLKHRVGVGKVALTTNGFRLSELLPELKHAGLDALNISLDSLNPAKFKQICGPDLGEKVMASIDRALELGFGSVKVNTVLLKGLNDGEFRAFMEFVRGRPVSIRFIELMRTADNETYFKSHHVPTAGMSRLIQEMGWRAVNRAETAGPANEFTHPDYLGRVGFIAPYSKDFCASCNRLRVSSKGALRLCLFGEGRVELRDLLASPEQSEELKRRIFDSLKIKPAGHRLEEQIYGDMTSLSTVGG